MRLLFDYSNQNNIGQHVKQQQYLKRRYLIFPIQFNVESTKQETFAQCPLRSSFQIQQKINQLPWTELEAFPTLTLYFWVQIIFMRLHLTVCLISRQSLKRQKQSLRVLDLSNNNIRISDNSEGLQSLPSIQYLYLNGNELTAWTIGGNTRKLKELRIDNNQLKALEFVGSKGTLETLSAKYVLNNQNYRNNCLESVESIVELTSLKELYLDHNGIKGFATINSCTSLRILSLTNNKIAEYVEWTCIFKSQVAKAQTYST
eukprot:TRINITY_DN1445_c0_g1_i3.p1 TRINITY_DN1445_c0_g1~~TRINITY_DN1445_c0_g1_i3.p1  ORF type:complete len:285 (-),score=-35.16 TRINITY_DN1445_c0_g1_i3:248-1027(-)